MKLKDWYLSLVSSMDKSEFKEDEHPRGKGGMFVKKGEGGGGSSALEEAYKKGGFKHPEELAKADFEELGKMNDSRLDAEITLLEAKVEEGGKPFDKARLEAAKGIMDGRKSTKKNSLVGLSDEMLEGAVRYCTSMLNDDKVSPKDKEEAKRIIERAKSELAKRGKSEPTLKFKKGDKVKVPDREGVHEITGIVDSMYGGKLYEVDNDHRVGYSESEISNVGKNDSVMDVEPLQMAKTLKDRVGKIDGGEYFVGGEKGNLSVMVTFDKGKENLVISKFEDKSGLGLVQKEYDKSGWVLFDIYDKKSLPSKIDVSYMERDEVPLAKATEDGLKGISPITEKEASDYWYAGGFRKQLPLPNTYAVQKRMVNHLVLNMKHGIGTNGLSIPKRFVDYIASSPLGKHYSNKK